MPPLRKGDGSASGTQGTVESRRHTWPKGRGSKRMGENESAVLFIERNRRPQAPELDTLVRA